MSAAMTIAETFYEILTKVNGTITLIRYFHGKQSDSMVGDLFLYRDRKDSDLMANFNSNGIAIIFSMSDISSTESIPSADREFPKTVIRLKSPADYDVVARPPVYANPNTEGDNYQGGT